MFYVRERERVGIHNKERELVLFYNYACIKVVGLASSPTIQKEYIFYFIGYLDTTSLRNETCYAIGYN